MNYEVIPTNINEIKNGDVIFHNGKIMTIGRKNIRKGGFMGTTIFGDSYRLGTVPVQRLKIIPLVMDKEA